MFVDASTGNGAATMSRTDVVGAAMDWKWHLVQIAALTISLDGSAAAERQGRLHQPPPPVLKDVQVNPASLYEGRVAVLARYAGAMTSQRLEAARNPAQGAGNRGFDGKAEPGGRWTFVSGNGHWVERRSDGTLALSLNDYLANWYAEVECRITQWPTMACEDGRTRTISAPSATTIRIDDETFELTGTAR